MSLAITQSRPSTTSINTKTIAKTAPVFRQACLNVGQLTFLSSEKVLLKKFKLLAKLPMGQPCFPKIE